MKAVMIAVNETSVEIDKQVAAGEYMVVVDGKPLHAEVTDVKGQVECAAGQTNVDMMCG